MLKRTLLSGFIFLILATGLLIYLKFNIKPNFSTVFKNNNKHVAWKWNQYISIYERLFSLFKGKRVTVLEIGILNGGFLDILSDYFPAGSSMIGLDIEPECADLKFHNKNIEVVIGDATDKDIIDKYFKNKSFDIIIDDASHISSSVIKTFELLFPKLNNGGLYIIEDTHASYYADLGGGLRKSGSTVEYFKNLIDSLHLSYIDRTQIKNDEEIQRMMELNEQIASISFYDSIIVVEKYMTPKKSEFYSAITSGKATIVPINGIMHIKDAITEGFYR